MSKHSRSAQENAGTDLEELAEILDEDHLEFEEMLLQLQERSEHMSAQLNLLIQQVSETRAEILESRELVDNLEAKFDRMMAILVEWRREETHP